MTVIQKRLFEMQDSAYRDFNAKLIPSISKETVIGVRTPLLRKYAKELFKSGNYNGFLEDLPHTYYEENNLHSFLIAQIESFDTCLHCVEAFLPYVDNWATCDTLTPKSFTKNKNSLLPKIKEWLSSDKTYTLRFGIKMLMDLFLDQDFKPEYLTAVSAVKSDEYYVKMMVAWYFATALAKQYNTAVLVLEKNTLDAWVHNKTIQKAVESYRISAEQKEYLKTLRI